MQNLTLFNLEGVTLFCTLKTEQWQQMTSKATEKLYVLTTRDKGHASESELVRCWHMAKIVEKFTFIRVKTISI